MTLLSSSEKYFVIAPETVNVYSVSVSKNRHALSIYNDYLSTDEQVKSSRFKFNIDKERFVISRAILRMLSGRFLNIDPKLIRFNYNEFGKPHFQKQQRLKFNLSHSGDVIVIGFTRDYELGVDVEYIKPDSDFLKLAQNFFSRTEIEYLENQDSIELAKAFFRCWTRKESFIKAEGSGLSFPLDKFAVSMDTDTHAELLQTDWDSSERLNWNLFSFVPRAQYIGAVAVKNTLSKVKYFDWN